MNPDTLSQLTLSTLPKHLRQVALWFVITLTVGYSTGLVFVAHTTGLTPKGAEERYRGNQPGTSAIAPAAQSPSSGLILSDSGATASGALTGGDTSSVSNGILKPDAPSSGATASGAPAGGDTSSVSNGILKSDTPAAGTPAPNTSSASTPSAGTPAASAAPAPALAEEPEMKFEKSLPEMLNIAHTHILAMTSFLVLSAAIFALSSRPSSRVKSFLIVEPFVAILTSFGAMWLMRYVHPKFSYLLMASSGSFALCFYAMMFLSFRELIRKGER